jgi:hypothetical protein
VRLVLVQQGSLDDMLDAEEQLSEQLESLPYLVRFQYDKSRCVPALNQGCATWFYIRSQ